MGGRNGTRGEMPAADGNGALGSGTWTSSDLSPAPSPLGADPYVGSVVGERYVLERLLGAGGMAFVYAARHRIIGKKVAVKILRPELAKAKETARRFLQEAKATLAIKHPHIVEVSDFGSLPDGSDYFVMEYVEGESLASRIETGGPFDESTLLEIGLQIAEGLAAVHRWGIVHRDLKPDNVMLTFRDGQANFVKILDFGIAKVEGEGPRLTLEGSLFGTPHYMAPEQASGRPADERTDIYALGVILYEMASGKVPFDAEQCMSILAQHLYTPLVPPSQRTPGVRISPEVERIIARCMEKDPARRYASMGELALDLSLCQGAHSKGDVEVVRPDAEKLGPSPEREPKEPGKSRRHSWGRTLPKAGVLAFAALATLGIAAVFLPGSFEGTPRLSGAKPVTSEGPAQPKQAFGAGTAAGPRLAPTEEVAVALVSVPEGATVVADGKTLGPAPLTLWVRRGAPVTVEASLAGYRSRSLRLDGSESQVHVVLEALESPLSTPSDLREMHSPRRSPASGSRAQEAADLRDPWRP